MNSKEFKWLEGQMKEMHGKIDSNTSAVIKLGTEVKTAFAAVKYVAGGIALIISAIVGLIWR